MLLMQMSEPEGRQRARERLARGVTIERIDLAASHGAFHVDDSVEERLSAMTRRCRAAWLATGRPLPPSGRSHRASLPGEVYVPEIVGGAAPIGSHVAT